MSGFTYRVCVHVELEITKAEHRAFQGRRAVEDACRAVLGFEPAEVDKWNQPMVAGESDEVVIRRVTPLAVYEARD